MPLLVVALLVIPVAELWLILRVADRIGLSSTLALLLVVSVAGAWLLKQQGVATWNRLRSVLRAGRMPADEVTDGALILFGGALLLTPGFLTDVVGLGLLLPPARAVVKRVARRVLGRWARRRFGGLGGARVYPSTVTSRRAPDVEPASRPTRPRAVPPRPRAAEDDSRDRG